MPGESYGQRTLVGESPLGCRVEHNWAINTGSLSIERDPLCSKLVKQPPVKVLLTHLVQNCSGIQIRINIPKKCLAVLGVGEAGYALSDSKNTGSAVPEALLSLLGRTRLRHRSSQSLVCSWENEIDPLNPTVFPLGDAGEMDVSYNQLWWGLMDPKADLW